MHAIPDMPAMPDIPDAPEPTEPPDPIDAPSPPTSGDAPAGASARQRAQLDEIFGARFTEHFSAPVLVLKSQTLCSPVAKRLWNKDFSFLSKQLHQEYRFRSWSGFDQALLDRFATRVARKQQAIERLITQAITRLEQALRAAGADSTLTLWPDPLVIDVPVISSFARRHFELLKLLDRVLLLSGTCGLLGVLDSTQRTAIELTCRKAMRSFHALVQQEVTHLYREGRRVRDRHAAPAATGAPDPATAVEDDPPPAECTNVPAAPSVPLVAEEPKEAAEPGLPSE